jgi:predicted transcriptional regulator
VNQKERRERLKAAAERAQSKPESVTVRELMSWFDARRRGYKVVERMRRELRRADLRTEPDFASAHVDSFVRLVTRQQSGEESDGPLLDEMPDVQLRVSSLAAASKGVVCVAPDDTIDVACTKMSFNDYSQLAVLSGPRSLKGFISWDTIGKRRLVEEPTYVRDAVRHDAKVVGLDDPLLPILGTVAEANFVFVRGADQTLAGIITAADITLEFRSFAGPYLLMGEVERRLRRILETVCEEEDLREATDASDTSRTASGVEDLTMGELLRLFQRPEIWGRLGWRLDRTEYVKQLNQVREIRNDLMHFAEEPPTADQVEMLEAFARTLAGLEPRSA